jgi:hypothetical protein
MPKKSKAKPPRAPKQKPKRSQTPKRGIVKGLKSGKPASGSGGYAEDIGSSIGSWLGQKAGGLFKRITGLGDYRVQSNTLVAATDPPVLSNTLAATRVQHREYICDIVGSVAWSSRSFAINPGLSDSFPWLASVAGAFEQYRLHGIVFEFKSTSASALNSTNTALGTVIMATEYNVLHPPFANKREMENYVYSTSSPPSVSAMHPVECARDVSVLDNLYVRNAPVPNTSDLRFSDLGRFQISTVGMQAAATIGELWCTYDVELIKPKLPDAFTTIAPMHYTYDYGTDPTVTRPTATNYFGTSTTPLVRLLGNGLSSVTLNINTITFTAAGRYLLVIRYAGNSTVNVSQTTTVSSSVTRVAAFASGSGGGKYGDGQTPDAGSTTAANSYWTMIDVDTSTTTAPTVTFNSPVMPAVCYALDLFITPLPNGFQSPISPTVEDQLSELRSIVTRLTVSNPHEDEKYVTIPRGGYYIAGPPPAA